MSLYSENKSNPYVFIERIGGGGFGEVYKGHELLSFEDKMVAIKVLNPKELDEESLSRFSREIRIHS
ncbi:hypothetical protein P9E03_19465 [Bacillus mojavensis]|uniref:Protein kinase domain-containing protein n=1 Tax=Bacillus mojavensis TaxID=72360 RepID=A0AAP3CNA0_BACMO|nr:hypothetical protein [Bacillus mojavensis]MCY8105429.1 hypothetical protein [Bacillus mojavensis]MCY8481842.1 hypothetical protein [Bacillus mojavensis]MCY8508291.1 hypothetical protein [Bacillus mojavensis]MEC1775999.1 hypothetical protein [Bacillus mojavensis]MEC1801209.1 hypothetical protein [Bacillus mojavensis]